MIKGTANQSIKTVVESTRSEGIELGPNDDKGGYRKGSEGTVEYRKSDNSTGSLGMVFTKGHEHLPWDVPQADRQPA